MYFTVTNTKIVRKLSFSLKFSKPKSKNAEKCQKCCFSAFLDFGFENLKKNLHTIREIKDNIDEIIKLVKDRNNDDAIKILESCQITIGYLTLVTVVLPFLSWNS